MGNKEVERILDDSLFLQIKTGSMLANIVKSIIFDQEAWTITSQAGGFG